MTEIRCWRDQAACLEVVSADYDPFFSDAAELQAEAIAICDGSTNAPGTADSTSETGRASLHTAMPGNGSMGRLLTDRYSFGVVRHGHV
jgi:hypothetical protein